MAIEPRVEMVDKGLSNTRDRSLIAPGALSRANNCYYKPHDPALHKIKGRAAYDSSATTPGTFPIIGLRYLEFNPDDASPRLLKLKRTGATGTRILSRSDFTAETGSWTDYSDTVGDGDGLESVYYNRRHLLLTGANVPTGDLFGNNLVYFPSGHVRRHGLAPVVSPPTVALGTGSWPNNTEFPLGWYFFITTEVTDESDQALEFIESSWEGDTMGGIDVSSAANGVTVTFPALVNTGQYADTSLGIIAARRIYMAGPVAATGTGRPENPALSEFFLVGQVPIGTSSYTVSALNLASIALPTVASGTFSSPNNALTDNNSGATAAINAKTLKLQTFGLSVSGSVYGYRVEMKARYNGVGVAPNLYSSVSVQLLDAAGAVTGTAKAIDISTRSWSTFVLGGPTDAWGATLTAANVNNANFGVLITSQILSPSSPTIEIDVVRVQVYATGGTTSFSFGDAFPYVSIPIVGGNTVVYPANSEPPVASSGDVFQGQVVLNDVDRPDDIVWSLPDRPEYYPAPYRMRLDIGREGADQVTCVRTLGEICLIGMKRHLIRVNKLPNESDSFFETGRAYDVFCVDKGVVNRKAITTFTVPGQPPLAAFVGYNGIFYTNGFRVDTLIEGINWEAMVNVSKLDVCWLENYPREHTIVFAYVPADDTTSEFPTKRLILHYHPSQTLEGGKLKVTGPIDLNSSCSAVGWLAGAPVLLTGNNNAGVYVEDRGWQDAANSNADLVMDVVTRDIYPAGVGFEATVERFWWRYAKYASPEITLTVTPWVKKTGGDYITPRSGQRWTVASKTHAANAGTNLTGDPTGLNNAGSLHRSDTHFICESVAFQLTTSEANNGFTLDYLTFMLAGKGPSENG